MNYIVLFDIIAISGAWVNANNMFLYNIPNYDTYMSLIENISMEVVYIYIRK